MTADLFTSLAVVDNIAGGAGTDILSVGTSGTAFATLDNDVWTRAATVETIKAVANTVALSINLDVSAATAGITTVDISLADSGANGSNLVDASEFTATTALTLTGSSLGGGAILGGAGGDTITGGAAIDTITGGLGADTMTGAGAADIYVFGTTGSVSGTSLDKITGFATASDVIDFTAITVLAAEANGVTATSDVDTSTGGLVTFHADDDTFTEMVVAILADSELDVAGSTAIFTVGGHTYVYNAGTATGAADDQIVELTGVTGAAFDTITDLGTTMTIG